MPAESKYTVHNILESLDINVETQGNVRYHYPIEIISPRGRFPLSLLIEYNSSSSSGNCGVGWNLREFFVEEVDGDSFFSEGTFRTKLTEVEPNKNLYRLENEKSYRLFTKEKSGGSWYFTDGVGNWFMFRAIWSFGLQPNKVTRWYPTQIQDANGNFAVYKYKREGGRQTSAENQELIFPDLDEIHYNFYRHGNRNVPKNKIKFSWLSAKSKLGRKDPFFLKSGKAFALFDKLLWIIKVQSKVGSEFRDYLSYVFNYQRISPETNRTLLNSITVSGIDGKDRLPALQFKYSEPRKTAFKDIAFSVKSDSLSQQYKYRRPILTTGDGLNPVDNRLPRESYLDKTVIDFNGDGIPELLTTHQLTTDVSRGKGNWFVESLMPPEIQKQYRGKTRSGEHVFNLSSWPGGGLSYGGSLYPEWKWRQNNRELFALGRSYDGVNSTLGIAGFYQLEVGGPNVLILPHKYFYRMKKSQGRFIEHLVENKEYWIGFVNRNNRPGGIFDDWISISVRSLTKLYQAIDSDNYSTVPLNKIQVLKGFPIHKPNEKNFTDEEVSAHTAFMLDIDGDGYLEYIVISDEGKTWQYCKMKAYKGSYHFDNKVWEWNIPRGVPLYPNLTKSIRTFSAPNVTLRTLTFTTLADVTGNGLLDFLSFNQNNEKVEVFYNSGAGFVKGPILNKIPVWLSVEPIQSLGAAEINGEISEDGWFFNGTQKTKSALFDINGDGQIEYVQIKEIPKGRETKPRVAMCSLFGDRWAKRYVEIDVTEKLLTLGESKIRADTPREMTKIIDFWSRGFKDFLVCDGNSIDLVTAVQNSRNSV